MNTSRRRRNASSASLMIECLEGRRHLSVAVRGSVFITASPRSDFITVFFRQNGIQAIVNGERQFFFYENGVFPVRNVSISGGNGHDIIKVNATGFDSGQRVRVRGGNGNDRIYIATATVDVSADGGPGSDNMTGGEFRFYTRRHNQTGVTLLGGNGNDRITGSAADDVLLAGNGNDTLVAGMGEDLTFGGEGSDIIINREPQDGDSTIDGGNGFDALVTPDGIDPDNVVIRGIEDVIQGE